jgi:hypothetical protein
MVHDIKLTTTLSFYGTCFEWVRIAKEVLVTTAGSLEETDKG